MSTQVKLSGYTESETLINYLKWLDGWAMSMLRAMRMMYNAIEAARNVHHYNSSSENLDVSFLLSKLDTMTTMLDGPATEMRHHFNLHHVGSVDGNLPVHISLEKAMQEIAKMCRGEVPVPVDSPDSRSVKDADKIKDDTKKQFADVVRKMCKLAETVQGFLSPLELTGDKKAHFVLNMSVVDDNGHPIRINEMDVDGEVKKFNEERLAEAMEKQFGHEGEPSGVPTEPTN